MRRNDNNQNMSLGDFLGRCLLWGGLGYIAGLRGSKLKGWSFLGPISERVFDFSLEDIGNAIVQECQQKEIEDRFSQKLEQAIRSPGSTESNLEERPISKLPLFLNTSAHKENSSLIKLTKPDELDIRWLDLIVHPSIVLILGGRGSGKTALGFRLLELFRYRLMPYVIGVPSQCANLLPDWIGVEEKLEDVPAGSISLEDEAYLSNHARDWTKIESRDLCRVLNLSRQQDKTIIFIAQQGRQLNLDMASSANVIVLKNPGVLQTGFERPALRQMVSEAKTAFESKSGDLKRWSYVYSPDANFSGMVENNLPTFWSQELSRIYGQMSIFRKASDKHPSKMTLEQKKKRARELYNSGWSYSQIARYFGVSKSTTYNWVHDYPYRKKDYFKLQ